MLLETPTLHIISCNFISTLPFLSSSLTQSPSRFSEHMQLYHPENAKEIMDTLGHVPLNAGPLGGEAHVKLPSNPVVPIRPPSEHLVPSDPGGHPSLKLSDPVAVGDAG